MVNTNTFLENRWSRPSSSALGLPNIWYQSKPGRPLRKRLQNEFIERQLRRERESRLGNCIRRISKDCKEMLKKKIEETECTILHFLKHSPIRRSETANTKVKEEKTDQKVYTQSLHPESIYMQTDFMIEGTDEGNWDRIWYINKNIGRHVCSNKDLFGKLKEKFILKKLQGKDKLLFIHGIGEINIRIGREIFCIPGVHTRCDSKHTICRPIRSLRNGYGLQEQQVCEEIGHYAYTCPTKTATVGYIPKGGDYVYVKGVFYPTKVSSFNEYVSFLDLIKNDDLVSQEWDIFRDKFNNAFRWFYDVYLKREMSGPIPPKMNGIETHIMDLYKLVESIGGYLSVYFAKEFGYIAEMFGLSYDYGEEIKECYNKYLDVFKCYYSTARVPQLEQESVQKKTTIFVDQGKELTCLQSHCGDQEDQVTSPIGQDIICQEKNRVEHFGVELEDIEETKKGNQHQATYQMKTKDYSKKGSTSIAAKKNERDTTSSSTVMSTETNEEHQNVPREEGQRGNSVSISATTGISDLEEKTFTSTHTYN
ncbi:ARID DNA-binding domain-containing protein [Tanacetum coccineum]